MTRPLVRPAPVSLFVGPDDRYVVSLVVAYGNDGATSPRDAALGALALLLDGEVPRTRWAVYDRVTDRVHLFAQTDLLLEEIDAA